MKLNKKLNWSTVIMSLSMALMTLLISSCGTEETSSTVEFTGAIVMGPVDGATVKIYELNPDGSSGAMIATAQSGSDGTFSVSVNSSSPLRFVATGGSYSDEATGELVQLQEQHQLECWIGNPQGNSYVGINALTTIAASYAYEYANQYAQENGSTHEWLKQSMSEIHNQVAEMFGLSDVDIVATHPSDLTQPGQSLDATSNAAKLGTALAAFTQIAKDNEISSDQVPDMLREMAEDYSDGSLDGTDAEGNTLQHGLDITPVQAMNGFTNAIQNFLNGSRNRSNITAAQMESQFQNQN